MLWGYVGHGGGVPADVDGGTARRRYRARERRLACRLLSAAIACRGAARAARRVAATRLAPKEKATQAVGLWFAGCAVGNSLARGAGAVWERWPHHRYFGLLPCCRSAPPPFYCHEGDDSIGSTAQSNNACRKPR